MNPSFSNAEFYKKLEVSLPSSTAENRIAWAAIIIEKDIEIKYLSKLLTCEKKVASQFSSMTFIEETLQHPKITKEPSLDDVISALNRIDSERNINEWRIS